MQITAIISSILLAASGTQAAPSSQVAARQIIPFNIALSNTNGCGPNRFSTFFPNNGTTCQTLPQAAASAFATTNLPAGCTVTVYSNPTCSSVNFIQVPHDTSCFTFGGNLLISSLKVSGTCPGFQQA